MIENRSQTVASLWFPFGNRRRDPHTHTPILEPRPIAQGHGGTARRGGGGAAGRRSGRDAGGRDARGEHALTVKWGSVVSLFQVLE